MRGKLVFVCWQMFAPVKIDVELGWLLSAGGIAHKCHWQGRHSGTGGATSGCCGSKQWTAAQPKSLADFRSFCAGVPRLCRRKCGCVQFLADDWQKQEQQFNRYSLGTWLQPGWVWTRAQMATRNP